MQKFFQLSGQLLDIAGLALPHYQRLPTCLFERFANPFIPSYILVDFLIPKRNSGRRTGSLLAPLVAVPEATMDENDLAMFRQNNIRTTGKIAAV